MGGYIERINMINLETLISINEKGYVVDINDGQIANIRIANIRKEKE